MRWERFMSYRFRLEIPNRGSRELLANISVVLALCTTTFSIFEKNSISYWEE